MRGVMGVIGVMGVMGMAGESDGLDFLSRSNSHFSSSLYDAAEAASSSAAALSSARCSLDGIACWMETPR